MKHLLLVGLLITGKIAFSQDLTPAQYKEDFNFFWKTINDNYCYWDKVETDWNKVKAVYSPMIDTVTTRKGFVLLLEKVFNEIYDHHSGLNTNYEESQRLVPTGTDIWAEYAGNKPIITEVRPGSGAANCGLRPGMEIISVNDIPVGEAIKAFLPLSLKKQDIEANNYALRVLLAGRFLDDRKLTVRVANATKTFFPDRPRQMVYFERKETAPVESKILPGNIGYILINNRLGDNGLISIFDSVLRSFENTKSLILDLRNTPSGGNTTVARAIMGSFIKKEGYFQKHELTSEERETGVKRSWVEIVSPREWIYEKPLAILCNHWSGSVSEGMVIGFDALKRGKIIGTPMAKLKGAIYSFQMPNSKIGFAFPFEKLKQVNDAPREMYKPHVLVDMNGNDANNDIILKKAIQFLNQE